MVALFKRQADGTTRVSLRSKDDVDVRSVAGLWSGGGHKNAAGCSVAGAIDGLQKKFIELIEHAIDGRPAHH